MRIVAFEFLQFLFKLLLHILVPVLALGALIQLLDIVFAIAQFFLNGANLLLQEVLTLLLRQIFSGSRSDICLQFHKLRLFAQCCKEEIGTLFDISFLKHFLLLVRLEWHVGGEEIDQIFVTVDVLDSKSQFIGAFTKCFENLVRNILNRRHQHTEFLILCDWSDFFKRGDTASEIWFSGMN